MTVEAPFAAQQYSGYACGSKSAMQPAGMLSAACIDTIHSLIQQTDSSR